MLKKLLILIAILLSFSAQADPLRLNPENTVFIKDIVWDDTVTTVMNELSKRENNAEPVLYLVLDTPGGSVFAGLNLIHFLKGFPKPVKTITIFSASMGFQIAEGNPGDRLIVDTGILMSHPMSGGEYGQFGEGMSIENRTKSLNEIIKAMDEQVVARTNGKQTLESYRKDYDNELWTTGKNSVDKGYADEVVTVSCSPELTANSEVVEEREYVGGTFAVDIKYEFSKCPLMLSILKYQVVLVDVLKNKKYVLMNKGYEIPTIAEEKKASIFDLFGNNSAQEIDKITAASKKYQRLLMYLDRNLLKTKKISEF